MCVCMGYTYTRPPPYIFINTPRVYDMLVDVTQGFSAIKNIFHTNEEVSWTLCGMEVSILTGISNYCLWQ